MENLPASYVLAMNVFLVCLGIFFFYLISRTHPCWKFLLFLHGIFTLDAYYIEKFPFAFSFAIIALAIFLLSFFYLRGETGERLNNLIEDKILKRFSCKGRG